MSQKSGPKTDLGGLAGHFRSLDAMRRHGLKQEHTLSNM